MDPDERKLKIKDFVKKAFEEYAFAETTQRPYNTEELDQAFEMWFETNFDETILD